ncbi:uncharacterized protein Dwil_GK10679 [Drosophila willistoni]|uniref:Vacuolar protein sorting-associated protein 13 n=1 Tax=Drosophila willistoni TaxID=7260 RepID=B4MIP9_DROWI|nr:vacuolar protein sorting-associated protein 13 [Drosophila willistoni]EDW71988.1 uncharacterized protein Dwil_GK10679 [Drosophila willistoni]
MVFEALVVDILNKVLGDYIENLDRNQLKIGIWGGDVVLQNLRIRDNALDDLDLPVQLVYGYLGKLVLKIPWKNLYSQPVIVDIDSLYVLVSPNNNVRYNAEKEAKYALEAKKVALDALEAERKKELDKDKPKADPGFTEKLTAQIVNNLQVKISNVHLRYEDTSTTGSPFSFGISLHELELYTTDNNWEKCYMAQQTSQVFKIANLSCLSAYMNVNARLYSGQEKEQLAETFQAHIANKEFKPASYSYVLGPICCNAKLKLNMNPEFDDPPFEIPKIDLTLEMETLNVGLTSTQFHNIAKLGDSMNRMQLGLPYRKYRPHNLPYKGNAKTWWKFAINSVLEEDVRRNRRCWTWEYIKQHRDRCNMYAEKYKERELNKKPPATLLESCTLLEQELDVFNLLLIRQRVNIEIAKLRVTTPPEQTGWFSGWWGSGGAKKDEGTTGENIVKKFEAAMTPEEKAKLYKAIGYQENANPLNMPESYEAMRMNFKLIALEVGLYEDVRLDNDSRISYDYQDLPSILKLKFSMATAKVTQRPAAEAISITAGMKELSVFGRQSKESNRIPLLVESKITDEFNLLDIFFETNPLDKLCDQRVKVVARPLQIVYDADTILSLLSVFKPPNDVTLSKFEDVASAQLGSIKERSATGMQYVIDQKSVLDADILLMPNILVVPHGGLYVANEKSLVVVSLGQVHVTTTPRQRSSGHIQNLYQSGEHQHDILKNVMDNAYDRFTIEVDDIQVLVSRPGEPWQQALNLAVATDLHVLKPTSLKVVAALCVVDDDPRLPKVKVDIEVPAIQVNVSEDRVIDAIGVGTSIPLPENSSPAQPSTLQRSRSSLSNFINKEIKKRNTESAVAIKKPLDIDEITQYTNVEVNFSLNEISLRLYQSQRLCENDSVVTQEFVTPEQEPSTSLQHGDLLDIENTRRAQEILSLQVLQVEAYLAQRTYETVATLKVGGLNIKQFDCVGNNEKVLDIIDTPGYAKDQNYLFTVSYTLADKLSPEFTTKYNSTEQLIVVNFEILNIVLHQECLLSLLEVSNNFQRNLERVLKYDKPHDRFASAGAGDGIKHKLAVIMEDTEHIMTTNQMTARRSKAAGSRHRRVVESIKIRLVANLLQVGLQLTSRNRPLAEMNIKKFVTRLTMKSSYTELNIGLKDIQVIDLNPYTKHQNILSIVGQDAFNCQVVLYNKDETLDYNSDDMKITVDIGCMKIIFLNWFVAGVLNFLNNFQAAQQALSDASAAAAESARQKAMDAYETATRMKLNVRINAPIIIIPVDSKSCNALSLDLGMLELTNNTIEVPVQDREERAIIDEIKLQLKDIKITKVTILEADDSNVDDVDAAVGWRSKLNMMNPMSFTLLVTRNLSSQWYKEVPDLNLSGRLKSIELTLFTDDYALIMSILNRNLSEGLDEFPPIEKAPPKSPTRKTLDTRSTVRHLITRQSTLSLAKNKRINESLKFNFQFDGVIINLMEAEDAGLARFGIYFLSVKGSKLVDNTLSVSVVLCNIQLDDTRKNTTSQIHQYLSRKDWQNPRLDTKEIIDACYNERNFMVDVTAIVKENDTFAEVHVRGFDLIVSIDFLLKLTSFLTVPPDNERNSSISANPHDITQTANDTLTATRDSVRGAAVAAANEIADSEVGSTSAASSSDKRMHLILHIDEPDIILVESLDDLNTNAIIFNAQVHLNYRSINEKQIINGQIDALKIYMSAFLPERREATRHYILHPCVISLQGSTPEEEGLHISLKLSDIIINVSPATIELLNKAMLSISTGHASNATENMVQKDYSKLWYPKQFSSRSYWFTKVEEATEAFQFLDNEITDLEGKQKTEKCVIEMPSIALVIESGMGYYTKPLVSLETRITAVFNNWSRNLSANGSITLNMNYFNQRLAEWEPIIELNEVVNRNGVSEYVPWELKFDLGMEKVQSEVDDFSEEYQTTNMKIHSNENLEITLSKTCVSLLGELGEAFSQAIDQKGLIKPEIVAPYVVENDTGFDITLDLCRGIFTLHEVHRGGTQIQGVVNSTLLLQTPTSDDQAIVDPSSIQTCTISSGGRAYLQTKDISGLSDEQADDYNLYAKVGGIDKEVILPVSKADVRYFPLLRSVDGEPWGIISEVKLDYGTTKVNIHGVVNVHNHFSTSINVYRRKQPEDEEILVGTAKPGEVFHVPLHAIYADSKELYFSIKGYKTSVQGISWRANPSDMNYSHQLQCDPTSTFEPLYINSIRRKDEVYYENTNKFKLLSAFYTIHLRPPLYLRNSLPIDIKVSVAGCSVRKETVESHDATQDLVKKYNREEFLDYGEKVVEPGDVLHLPTVKMSQKGKETKSFLVVRLIQYLEKDWSCSTDIAECDGEVSIWTFCSYDSEIKMDMDLYVRSENRHGSLVLTIYSPFWMINKTGQMLTYKTDASSLEVLYHPPEYSGPILFTFRDKLFFDKKKASIRFDNGEWSEKIPLDVAGSVGEVTCRANDQKYSIGVHNHLTQNSLTKQITFIPFYIIRNHCRFDIEVQEQTRPGDPWMRLNPEQCEPLWPKNEANRNLIVRVEDKTTPAFDYTEVVCTLLKLNDSIYGGVNVDVQTTEGGVYITFTEYKKSDAPGLLINHTSHDIVYSEKGTKNDLILRSRNSIMYAWSDPAGPKVLIFGNNKQESDLRRDNVGEVTLQNGRKAYWVSFLDGLQRVLLFTEIESIAKRTESSAALQTITQSIDLRIHGIGVSVVNNETGLDILYLGVTSSGIIWESKKPDKKRFREMTIHDTELIEADYQRYLVHKSVNDVQTYKLDNKFPIDFNNMIIKKSNVDRQLRRSFYPAIWVSKKSSPFQNQLHVKINRIQVDNQFIDPIFPVVLAPIAPPKSVASTTTLKPFIECSMVQRVMPNTTVKQFKYASILIQEFHFKLDILFLTAIAEMFAKEVTDEVAAKQFRGDVESIELPLSAFFEQHSQQEQKNFYDNLHLGPLKIHVSFSMAGTQTAALPGFLGPLVQGVGVTLTDVNDVVFRLAFFEREYQFFTQQQLINEVTSHYTGQALKQLYVLVLGLDVLGNPYGLVVGLKKGVEDLFYEPFQGAIQGPGEFAEGLVLGVKSLFGHTVGGAAGAMSKITGAMGKGLAALTFDEDYQRKRRQGIHNKPKNFHEGLARSSKGLVMGFVDGVTGVVTKPVSGAREHGVEGFFKGLGKGAIGLVARPTAGVVDFASGSFEAVKRATEAHDEVKRMRAPRFQHYDYVLRPYCNIEAMGNKMLKELDKGKYSSTDNFIHCEEIIQKSEYLLVTNHRLLYIQRNEMFGIWTSLWTYLWEEIKKVEATNRGVKITVPQEGKKMLGLFSTKESPCKLVLLPDERKRNTLVEIIESHRQDRTSITVTSSPYASAR